MLHCPPCFHSLRTSSPAVASRRSCSQRGGACSVRLVCYANFAVPTVATIEALAPEPDKGTAQCVLTFQFGEVATAPPPKPAPKSRSPACSAPPSEGGRAVQTSGESSRVGGLGMATSDASSSDGAPAGENPFIATEPVIARAPSPTLDVARFPLRPITCSFARPPPRLTPFPAAPPPPSPQSPPFRVVSCNRSFVAITGYTEDVLRGQTLDVLYAPSPPPPRVAISPPP